jgi:C4-dicarboxylate transporter, DctM subunit
VSSLFFSLLESFALRIEKLSNFIRDTWTSFREGPLRSFFFYLILCITGIIVLLEAICEECDRFLANIEKAFISIALLIMVSLSFLDYLRREVNFFTFEIEGGANMAVVLMVWVGFLGASLATRQKKHLSVDATDKILSPAAARLTKRFTAFLAAGFCWVFAGHAKGLIEQSLISGAGQDALPLWDVLLTPVNYIGSFLLNTNTSGMIFWSAIIPLLILVYVIRSARDSSIRKALEIIGTILLLVVGVSFAAIQWQPEQDGKVYTYTPFGQEELSVEEEKKELQTINSLISDDTGTTEKPKPSNNLKNIQNLISDDTGTKQETKKTDKDTSGLEAFLEKSSGGDRFPLWLAQSIIPLSFFLMALRFLALALSGRFDKPQNDDDEEDGHSTKLPPPPLKWIESTGRSKQDLIVAGLFPGILIGLLATWSLSLGSVILMGSVLLVFTGAPLFLAIGAASLGCVTLIQDISAFNIAKDMYEAVKKEELLAIPFFILAGNLMTKGSIAERLVNVARAFMGKTPGGLGLASIFACVIFAAISGSSPVTVIAVGSIMFPMLVRERYPENYSLGVLTSAGSLGIIIPPSVPMIIYAIMVSNQDQQVSPNDLFIAGVLPGLFIAAMLALYTLYQTRPTRKDIDIVVPKFEKPYWSNLFHELRKSFLSILLPVLVLGGIYGVLGPLKFTVTEAAAVAVVYALVVELVFHRELKFSKLPKVLSDSGVMMGGLFLIIVLAIAFNKFLAEQYIPQNAAAWMQAHVNAKWQFLILVNIFLIGLGCVMDIISAILIVAPLLAPIAMSYGIHPLHFGIMFIVNLELGYLTPPLGINLFVAAMKFNRPVIDVMKGTLPFLLLMLFCLIIIVCFPFLSLALI